MGGPIRQTPQGAIISVCTEAVGAAPSIEQLIERVHPDDRQVLTPGLFGRALVAACLPKIKIEQSKVAKQLSPRLPHNAVSKNHGHFSKDYRNEFGELHPKL
jgi:hypothetical protein